MPTKKQAQPVNKQPLYASFPRIISSRIGQQIKLFKIKLDTFPKPRYYSYYSKKKNKKADDLSLRKAHIKNKKTSANAEVYKCG